jgi:predicted negative regulator of RcsB-dependent stress response
MQQLKLAVLVGDSALMEQAAGDLAADAAIPGNTVEAKVNVLGYLLLGAHRVDAALPVFALNVEWFSASANVHDSYGEALLAHGDTTAAIAGYRRSLELDPGNDHARQILHGLGEEVGN